MKQTILLRLLTLTLALGATGQGVLAMQNIKTKLKPAADFLLKHGKNTVNKLPSKQETADFANKIFSESKKFAINNPYKIALAGFALVLLRLHAEKGWMEQGGDFFRVPEKKKERALPGDAVVTEAAYWSKRPWMWNYGTPLKVWQWNAVKHAQQGIWVILTEFLAFLSGNQQHTQERELLQKNYKKLENANNDLNESNQAQEEKIQTQDEKINNLTQILGYRVNDIKITQNGTNSKLNQLINSFTKTQQSLLTINNNIGSVDHNIKDVRKGFDTLVEDIEKALSNSESDKKDEEKKVDKVDDKKDGNPGADEEVKI